MLCNAPSLSVLLGWSVRDSLQVSSCSCLLGCLALTSSLSLAAEHYIPIYVRPILVHGEPKNMQRASAITTVRCPSAQACSAQPTHTQCTVCRPHQAAPSVYGSTSIMHFPCAQAGRGILPIYLHIYIYIYVSFCVTANLTDAYKYAFVRLARPGGIT